MVSSFIPSSALASGFDFSANKTILENCRKRFIQIGHKVARKIDEKNSSSTPLLPKISGYSFLKMLNPEDILHVEDTEPLIYKNLPVEVLFSENTFKVRCSTILKASDRYLFGLVAHEIFRKMDKENETHYEGDQYLLSRQLNLDNSDKKNPEKSFGTNFELYKKITDSGYTKYVNSCEISVMSTQGEQSDLIISLSEYKHQSNDSKITVFSEENSQSISQQPVDISSEKKINYLNIGINEALKHGNAIFNSITQFSKKEKIAVKRVLIQNDRFTYNLNDDAYMECRENPFGDVID